MSLYARLAALAAAVLIILGIGWKVHHSGVVAGRAEIQAQWNAERVKLQAEVSAQAERNRDLQRQSEKRYTVQAEARDRFIVQTITEVRHETQNLAACVLTGAARMRLNSAAECAGQDRPAACGAGQPLPSAGPAH